MPGALLILAPRHPERFGEVERLARDAGFVTARRSELPIDAEPRADVVVLDTIGELAQLYQMATAVFVGGSLGRPRRPQHPRAGDLRQADRVRAAHAELQGDRRHVPRQRRRRAGAVRARARRGAAGAGHRSGAPRAARRRGARAGRGQPRRQGQDARGDRRAPAARRDGQAPGRRGRASLPAACIDPDTAASRSTARRRAWRRRVVRARSGAASTASSVR